VIREEGHLLDQAPLHAAIVAIEPVRARFAEQHLLVDLPIDERPGVERSGSQARAAFVVRHELLDLRGAHDDRCPFDRSGGGIGSQRARDREERRTDRREVQRGRAQPAGAAHPHAHEFGVYQMGDVQARSWIVWGTLPSQHASKPACDGVAPSQVIPLALHSR